MTGKPRTLNWQDYAACRFVKERGDGSSLFLGSNQPQKAKKICAGCEVNIACLYYALMMEPEDRGSRFGIFGMATPDERHAMNIFPTQAAGLYYEEVQMWSRHKAAEIQRQEA